MVRVVPVQVLFALGVQFVEGWACFGNSVGVLLVVVIALANISLLLAGDTLGVYQVDFFIWEGVDIVQGLIQAARGQVAAGLLKEEAKVNRLAVVGAVWAEDTEQGNGQHNTGVRAYGDGGTWQYSRDGATHRGRRRCHA